MNELGKAKWFKDEVNSEIERTIAKNRKKLEKGNAPEIVGFIKGLEFSKHLIELIAIKVEFTDDRVQKRQD